MLGFETQQMTISKTFRLYVYELRLEQKGRSHDNAVTEYQFQFLSRPCDFRQHRQQIIVERLFRVIAWAVYAPNQVSAYTI